MLPYKEPTEKELFALFESRVECSNFRWNKKPPTVRGFYWFWNPATDTTHLYKVTEGTHKDGNYYTCWIEGGARSWNPPKGLWSPYIFIPEPSEHQKSAVKRAWEQKEDKEQS